MVTAETLAISSDTHSLWLRNLCAQLKNGGCLFSDIVKTDKMSVKLSRSILCAINDKLIGS